MGKGSKRRPSYVSRDTFDDNWDRIFGTPHKPTTRKRVKNIHYEQEHKPKNIYDRKKDRYIVYEEGEG